MRTGTWLSWIGGVTLLLGVVACTQAPAPKSELYVCEAGKDGCPKAQTPTKRDSNELEETTQRTPDDELTPLKAEDDEDEQAPPPPSPPPPPPPAPVTGPFCSALENCCHNLLVAGITGSANQCVGVVKQNNETACAEKHQEYRTPDDFYDPVCF